MNVSKLTKSVIAQITLIGSNRSKQVNVLKDVTGCNGSAAVGQ
jgi:hypothetical protein